MTARQSELFPKPKRRPPRARAYATDVRKGVPCHQCNPKSSEASDG